MPTLNKKLIIKIADSIENRTIKNLAFDMESYADTVHEDNLHYLPKIDQKHECKTSACMAGWNAIVSGHISTPEELAEKSHTDFEAIHEWAKKDLGLTERQATHLFTEETGATDEESVRHLKQIVQTGVVDWSKINENYRSFVE